MKHQTDRPAPPQRGGADDPYAIYEIGDGIYWVGFADTDAGFSNNPYLIVEGDEAVLIDPGSVLHYHVVAKKVLRIVAPEQITAIIVQHQDPDLCASIPKFEALIDHPIRVIVHPRSALFMPYYGITSEFQTPADGEVIHVGARPLQFLHTPYVHFAGTFIIWDRGTGTLFSSDVFGALSRKWKLFADDDYVEESREFSEVYFGSPEAWRRTVRRVKQLQPRRICPQHGSIIETDVDAYLDAVMHFNIGRMIAGPEETAPHE